jgi:general stress protein 26
MEKNYFDTAAVKKVATLIRDIGNCFFITQFSGKARPMSTGKFDEKGAIWFFTDIKSEKVKDIEQDTEVRLLYADPRKNAYLDIQGEADVVTDRKRIRELWNPIVSMWFPDGVDYPDLCLLRIVPFNAYYWDVAKAKMMQAIKLAASIITGENLVEGKEGTLS